ncbi:hypothetical protein [Fusibacillus kribbianus]|uniref:Uncharacterized protein n=1 Tax=Fusibacillus kribbianus TaxID=3044208 RepID=A0AAP4B8C3_9FIRM|nr:hypothetical protein [Ruminococcus sp. YH-rum2234]MDI9241097.1 hypothetical protein [Ruminococcus sp. YH-rum2234]
MGKNSFNQVEIRFLDCFNPSIIQRPFQVSADYSSLTVKIPIEKRSANACLPADLADGYIIEFLTFPPITADTIISPIQMYFQYFYYIFVKQRYQRKKIFQIGNHEKNDADYRNCAACFYCFNCRTPHFQFKVIRKCRRMQSSPSSAQYIPAVFRQPFA